MENIECVECENRVLGLSVGDPRPVGRDACPNCGESEFVRIGSGVE